MTREEAIKELSVEYLGDSEKIREAKKMAIQALEQEPCDDAISRQAVEEMIKAEMPERGMWEIDGDKEKETVCEVCVDLMQKLSELQPVIAKPCDDAISRQIISDYVESHIQEINAGYGDLNEHTNRILRMIVDYIESMPPVTPQPKMGHWIEDEYEMKVWCSECGEESDMCSKYCPNCGAKMEVEE